MTAETVQQTKLVSNILDRGYTTYQQGKQYALDNKVLGSAIKQPLEFLETQAETLKNLSPYEVEKVVAALDEKVDVCLKYGEDTKESIKGRIESAKERPVEVKRQTLLKIHEALSVLLKEDEKNKKKPEDVDVKAIVDEAREVLLQRYEAVSNVPAVKSVTDTVTNNVDKVLEISENTIDTYLPVAEEEEEAKSPEPVPRVNRAVRLSKVATRRLRKAAFSKLTDLKKRTTEVVPVDLLKYSEMLDMELMKGKVSPYVEFCQQTFDARVIVPSIEAKELVKSRVSDATVVASKYKAAVVNQAIESIEPLKTKIVTAVPENVSSAVLKFRDEVENKYTEYVGEPIEKIVAAFKEEVSKQKELQGKSANEELTLSASLWVLLLTANVRAHQEYDNRAAPVIAKMLGFIRSEPTQEEEPAAASATTEVDESNNQEEEEEQEIAPEAEEVSPVVVDEISQVAVAEEELE